MSDAVQKFREIHPHAQPCHGGGVVIIGEPVWKKVWVWGGFSQRMADRNPTRRQFSKHITTVVYSNEFDFEKTGWQEACRLAWEDAARRMA